MCPGGIGPRGICHRGYLPKGFDQELCVLGVYVHGGGGVVLEPYRTFCQYLRAEGS